MKKKVIDFVKDYRNIVIIIGLWLILCCIYYFFFISRWTWTKSHLNQIDKDFGTSFSASLLEDLTFFGAVSIVLLILTTKSLWNYTFDEKIHAIANRRNSRNNNHIFNFLSSSISRLLAYDRSLDVTITVTDYDAEQNAYKLFFDVNFNIMNICKDKDFEITDYHFFVFQADAVVDNDYGHVTSFTRKNLSNGMVTTYIDEPSQFKLSEKFSQKVDLSIAKDSEIELHLKYNVWSKTGKEFNLNNSSLWCVIRSERYVEKLSINIRNNLKSSLKYDVYLYEDRYKQNEQNGLSLHHNNVLSPDGYDPISYTKGIYPRDTSRIFFYKQ